MRKNFYRLFPNTSPTHRVKKNVYFIFVDADTNGYFTEAASYEAGDIEYFDSPLELGLYLSCLPHASWIITYNISAWASCFEAFIETFDYIGGIGKDNQILDLQHNDIKITIIDLFQFYIMPLPEAVNRMTGLTIGFQEAAVNAVFIGFLWSRIVFILDKYFNVYPSKTPGATAIKIFRRFMKKPISAAGIQTIKLTTAAIRPPALHWRPGVYENAYLYDINAAYPHAMRLLKYPQRLRLFCNHEPKTKKWIATVKIDYKCRGKFSPLSIPLKDDVRINPTEVKNTVVTLTYIDYQILQLTGDVKITKWIEGVFWNDEDEEDYFSDWAAAIEAVSLENDQNKTVLKIVSRSLHSKFSQRRTYTLTEIFKAEPKEIKKLVRSGKVADIYPLECGDIAIKKITKKRSAFKPFERPDWEALTLSMARLLLYLNIDQNTIYTHTDCIISTAPRDDLILGVRFGEWKNKDNGAAYIAGLGLYVMGESIGTTGLKTTKKRARDAIREAALGLEKTIKTLNYPGFLSSVYHGETDFTVRLQPYPRAMVDGYRAWVTRSPTRIIPIIPQHRLITSGGRERCLHL